MKYEGGRMMPSGNLARTVKSSSHPAATRTYLVKVQSAPPFLVCSLMEKHGAHNPGDAGSSPAGPTRTEYEVNVEG